MYTKIINNRLSEWVEIYNKVSWAQAGFRKGFSTVDNAFVLQTIINKELSVKW